MASAIEEAIRLDDWPLARRLIEAELAKEPEDPHWLITRLSITYYEEFDYQRSLELAEQALAIAPDCPLVLWDYACSLDMLDRRLEALAIYAKLIDRGIESIAYRDCGEGLSWARGVVVDSIYRMARIHRDLGDVAKAKELFVLHLEGRGPGCRSIYSIRKVRKQLKALEATSSPGVA